MKTKRLIPFLGILTLIYSCTANPTENNLEPGKFDFTINGFVENGDGLDIELYYSGKSLTANIENGKFIIKDSSENIERAEIRIKGSPIYGFLLIEPGESKIKFDVVGSAPNYSFSWPEILEGPNNKLYFDFLYELGEATSDRDWVIGDSIMMDSMIKFVYPDLRNQTFKIYDKYYDRFNSDLKLIAINIISDRLEGSGAFDKRYLKKSEINKIKKYFSMIDTSLSTNVNYQIAKTNIEMMEDLSEVVKFHDYTLEDMMGASQILSSVVKNNNFTILDFWWHGCGPCREFNQAMGSSYDELKKNGVELVGINVDQKKNDWKTASTNDEITWKNFYAGQSDIQTKYKIKNFPTYIVLNNKLEVIDVTFKNNADLICNRQDFI